MEEKNETYESLEKKLFELTAALEKGDKSLEESIELYREATETGKRCREILDNAKLVIEKNE